MGGMAAAGTLRQAGIDVQVYEQAHQFGRIGAGIQMLPNSMKVLRGIGVEDVLRAHAFAPYSHLNRVGDTGELKRELPMPEDLYGAPFLCMHRADLHEALTSIVPNEVIHLNKKLVGLEQNGGPVTLSFADGTTATADAVIGADGVHSLVRDIIIGPDKPIHRGRIQFQPDAEGDFPLPHQMVGRGSPYRDLLYHQGPQPALLRHQRAGAGGLGDEGVVVGQG
jgi:salicylate hydroxylase/6-hydroxynicotinate 3-monooxygenase